MIAPWVRQVQYARKAATQLASSQPVISKAVSELERAVGVPLLDRTPHGVELTPYGEGSSNAVWQCSMTFGKV